MRRRDFVKTVSLSAAAVVTGAHGPASAAPRWRVGRVRITDDDLRPAGILCGDLITPDLTEHPGDGDLCLAFTADGYLVVRYFQREGNGDARLTAGLDAETIQVFAPGAVMIFGRVLRVERDGKPIKARLNLRDFTKSNGGEHADV